MIRNPRRADRSGVTLTEVLVAMFVMAIGMISLLTLFPLGAMQVGQALRDDRATQLARQADAYIRQTWRTDVVPTGGNNEGYYWAMDDPYLVVKYNTAASSAAGGTIMRFVGSTVSPATWYGNSSYMISPLGPGYIFGPAGTAPTNNRPTPFTLTQDYVRPTPGTVTLVNNEAFVESFGVTVAGPSFPVWLDPAGVTAYPLTTVNRAWVAQLPASGFPPIANNVRIPRRTCQLVHPVTPSPPATPVGSVTAFELTSLTDDMAFTASGAPTATELGRQGRYSWAAVIQRPANELRTIADLTILVFDKRPSLPQAGDELVVLPNATQLVGSRSVQITLPNRTTDTSPVLLKRGGWIVDGTIDTTTGTNTRRQFVAYRVTGFTEGTVTATTTTYDVDLETPLKYDLDNGAVVGKPASQLYLFAGLIEVYTRPQLRPDSPY